jgi:autotransporter passenger strand-loop-strand repeat protein
LLSGGVEYVSSGGSLEGIFVSSGGADVALVSGSTNGAILSAGGREDIESGGAASGTVILNGGTQYVQSSGTAYYTAVSVGGVAYALSGGDAVSATVSGGGKIVVSSGGTASDLDLLSGGQLSDNGAVVVTGAGTLAGILLGSGTIAETGAGDLMLSGDGAKFAGGAVISGGTIELSVSKAIGSGYVEFVAPTTGSAVLQIDAADAPAAGGTFANVISNFNATGEDIDLRSIAFVAGASASVVGTDLVLTDGGHTYTFELAGGAAGAYPVLSDGHGGTLIDPIPAASHKALDPKVLAFAHALAGFAPSDAATAALVSSTSPAGQTPFAHAAASAGRG